MRLPENISLRSPVSYRAPLIDVRFTARLLLCITLCATLVATSYPQTSSAAILRQLPFSARLKSAGTDLPVADGNYSIVFSIYTVETGGTAAWSETQNVSVTDGVVSVNLGESTAFPSSLTFNDNAYYLAIKIGSDAEMSPRKRIGSVPTALNSDTVDGAHAGTAANEVLLLDSSGSINIQGSATLGGGVTIGSAITPSTNATVALGSSAAQFSTLYVGNIISGSGTLTLPSTTDTLVGRATTDALTNKTLTAPTIQGTVAAGTGLTLPAFTASGAITGSSSPTITGFGTINGATISGGALSGGTLSGGTVSGGTLSGGTISGSVLSPTVLTFSGASGTISNNTTDANLTINANGAGTIAIGSTGSGNISIGTGSTGDIILAGGSSDTGCTIANATGALSCASTINGANLSASAVNGLSVSSGVISSGTWNGNAIGRAYGGTGITTYAAGDLLYASATDTLGRLAGGTANNGKVLTITNGIPTWETSAASGDITAVIAGAGLTGGSTSGDATLALNTAAALTWSANGASGASAQLLSGTWFSGGTSTTTKPQFLIEPAGTTSTGWSTAGTGIGANAAVGFTGNLIDLQLAGVSKFKVSSAGNITAAGDLTLNGNFNVTGSSGTTTIGGALAVTGNTELTGSLTANGNVALGNATSDTITFTGAVASALIPNVSGTHNLGSATNKFGTIYAQSIIYDTSTTISTTSNSITINSDAAGDEDSYLEFYRGGALTSAKILWTAASDTFDFNDSVLVQGNTTLGNANTDITTIRGATTLSDSSVTYPLKFGADATLYRSGVSALTTNSSLAVASLTVANNNVNGATITGGTFSGGSVTGGSLSGTAMQGTGSFTITGGTGVSETLTLISSSNATKGDIQFFSSSNKITSGGNLTVAGTLATGSTINSATISGGTLSGGSLSGTSVSGTGWSLTATSVNGLQVDSAGLISGGATWNGNSIGAGYGGTGINTAASTGIATVSSGTWSISSSISATQGGTGQTTVTTGDLLFGSATNTWGKLAGVATGSMLVSGGVGAAPSWSSTPTLTTSLTVPTIATASGALTLQAASGTTKLLTSATNATLEIYGSGGTNKLVLTHDNTNATISSTSGELQLGGQGTNQLLIGEVGTAVNLVFEESSTISGQGANTITLGQSGDTFNLNTSGTTYNVGTLTATNAILNTSSTSSSALVINGPTSMAANLLDLQVNGSSKFSVSAAGAATLTGGTFGGTIAGTPTFSDTVTFSKSSGNALSVSSGNTTGTGTSASLSVVANSLTTGNALSISSTSLTSGTLVDLSFAGTTAAGTSTNKVLNISSSGANANSGQTTYGVYASNTHTGTTSTNVGGYFTASGGSTNYAAIFGGITQVIPTSGAYVTFGNTGSTPLLSFQSTATTANYALAGTASATMINKPSGGSLYFSDADTIFTTWTGNSTSATATFAGAGTVKTNTTGALTLDSGTTGAVNLGTGNNAKTINIGTGTAGNAINIGTNNTAADTIAIGSALDTVTLAGSTFAIDTADWDVSTTGALTGISGITTDGGYTQSGSTANTLTGATSLTAAGTALSVTNNATIGGTLTVPTIATASGALTLQSASGTTKLLTSATNATLEIYGSGGTNKLSLSHDNTNGVITSSAGELQLVGAGTNQFIIGDVGTASNLVFEESSTISGQGANTITLGQSGDTFNLNTSGTAYNVGTLSATNATLNTSSTSSSALVINGPTSLSANILDLQVNGSSKASISAAGILTSAGFTSSGTSTFTGQVVSSLAGAASTPAITATGAWYTGGTATTTKPQLLIEPTNTTSTGWSTAGTGIGVNGASAFVGNLLDAQLNGSSKFKVTYTGATTAAGRITVSSGGIAITGDSTITGTLSGITGITVPSGGATITGNSTITGTLGNLTGLTSSGTVTFSGLTTNGIVSVSSGILSSSASVGATNGGTGQTTVTTGDLLYGSATNTWGKLAGVATGSILVSGGVGAAPAWSATPTVTSLAATTLTSSTLTSSGALAITSAANGNISLTPNGTGDIRLVVSGNASQEVFIGDGGTTDYAKFDTSGALTFAGNARPYGEITLLPVDAVDDDDQTIDCSIVLNDTNTGAWHKSVDCGNYVDNAAGDSDEYIFWQFKLPGNYANSTNVQVDIYWYAPVATTGAAIFDVGYAGVADDEDYDAPTLTTVSGSALTTALVAKKINTSTVTLTSPSLSADDLVHLKINRDTNNAADTLAEDAKIVKVRIKYLVGS